MDDEIQPIDWGSFRRDELEDLAQAMDEELQWAHDYMERMRSSLHDMMFCQARVIPEDALEFVDLDMVESAERKNKIRQSRLESSN